jgi:23S rRNA (cytidine1920-2'-O)/16S rRNA (cytidine1409-2'-O)-methyltransferase
MHSRLVAVKRERLDVLLTARGLVESRARAAARILAGEVVVDDHRVDKPGTKVPVDAAIRLKGDGLPWVSRGGLKLLAATEAWPLAIDDRVAVDVGASTGGFTDVLLARGARKVFAIDVGWGQLHERLRQDPRVDNRERTHIARLLPGTLVPSPTLGVVDVSFISLRLVLPALVAQLARPADIVALIKPQFEVGREHVGKGGIVRDEAARSRAVADVVAAAAAVGLDHRATIPSPIEGADGNVEFLAWFQLPSVEG